MLNPAQALLLQEILPPASSDIVTERFAQQNTDAARCNGKCQSGSCMGLSEDTEVSFVDYV